MQTGVIFPQKVTQSSQFEDRLQKWKKLQLQNLNVFTIQRNEIIKMKGNGVYKVNFNKMLITRSVNLCQVLF